MRRIGIALALAIAGAIGVMPALAPVSVTAATPKLTIIGATTYDVLPEEGRVAVTVQLTAKNHLKNTSTRRFFFRTGFLTVLPGTSGFKITGGAAVPKVSVRSTTETYTNLRINFGANLAAGKSTTLTLTFDLKDPGGAPDRPVRISPSLVSFAAWAFATPETPGATVSVRFPPEYDVSIQRGPLAGPVPDLTGHLVWSSGELEAPLEFVADVAADRPIDYAETRLDVDLEAGPAAVVLRSWPDDPVWRERVQGLIERALPVLEREIGVAWPVDGELAVEEALVRASGGYAGLFDPGDRRIEIAYSAPDGVVLHELAHAWFNGRLVADRWIAEAFASYYAGMAATELGVDPAAPALPDEPPPAAIPLNAWGPSGTAIPDSETWAYAASLEVARLVAERAGPDALQAVWSKAARGVGAYQPDAAAEEQASGPPDWRGLLDLLEAETAADFDDLWRRWVARPEDVPALDDRAATRDLYEQSVELAGEWRLPPPIRDAMRSWRFDLARELLSAADAVQAQRRKLETSAAAVGATLPATLRTTFEGDGGLVAAAAEATAEQATLDAIAAAQAARPTETGFGDRLITAVGLFLTDPESQLAASLTAFAQGDLRVAYEAAQSADTVWSAAADVGRGRIVGAALLAIALLLLLGMVRQRRHREAAAADRIAPVPSTPPTPPAPG
ncbi:MAG TPA: hypothetical protein VMQ65_03915 [Candidatus Limnocylindria bacterium]|nr:hypothetical protein [Candidatus Limnocylindria bacterium]